VADPDGYVRRSGVDLADDELVRRYFAPVPADARQLG